MDMCRACLSTEKEMFALDEVFIMKYNLLTNLNISMTDGMPQCICYNCSETVNQFIVFRETSASNETRLKEILSMNIKSEDDFTYCVDDKINEDIIKQEIKKELKDNYSVSDDYSVAYEYEYLEKPFINVRERKARKCRQKEIKEEKFLKKAVKLKCLVKEDEDLNFLCGICTRTFATNDELTQHLEGYKNYRNCQLCAETLDSWSQLMAHRLQHLPVKQKRCHLCMKRYVGCDYLEYHYRNVHAREEGLKLRCKQCNSLYDTPRKLKKHMYTTHAEKKFVCDHCLKRFSSKSVLKVHMASHAEKSAYVCDVCGFKSKYAAGLSAHILRKHTLTKVYCKVCQRPFKNQEVYDKHKCVKKVVICPICGVQFTRNMKLSRHMNVHSDIPKYECHRCPAKFKSKYSLTSHLDRHDGNRRHQCQYCPAKFYTGASLIKHRRVHTGEKPYVCKVCGKGFTGNYNLKVHMKVHGEYLINKRNKEPNAGEAISI